jgi:hypothetical protein
MRRRIVLLASALSLSGCGPPLVWGGDQATRDRLLKIVPVGSAIGTLEAEAKSRGWRISSRDDRAFPKGEEHYFGNGCQHQGGMSENIVVAEYGLLTTTVESVWMFDRAGRLGDICVRRSTDAL